jgi:hypothetical protein
MNSAQVIYENIDATNTFCSGHRLTHLQFVMGLYDNVEQSMVFFFFCVCVQEMSLARCVTLSALKDINLLPTTAMLSCADWIQVTALPGYNGSLQEKRINNCVNEVCTCKNLVLLCWL